MYKALKVWYNGTILKIRNYIMNQLIEQTNELLTTMSNDLEQWYSRSEFCTDEQYIKDRMEGITYHFEEGRNFIKLLKSEESQYDGSLRSGVVGFIVKKSPKAIDNKTNEPFNVGDMLMAAGYNAPSTNFARGNVLTGYSQANVRWTGIQ